MKKIKSNILLSPGPANTTYTVKCAQVVPDICPREKEFGDLMDYVSRSLTELVADNQKYTTILFSGSGTAAVEAMLSSVVNKTEKLMIINNGAYGQRMCEIAGVYGLDYLEFKSSSVEALDLLAIEKTIKNNTSIKWLAVVHNETTSGLLNDISSLGEICKNNDITMLVDAVSSYAAIPINMFEMNISYLAASSNKNIQGMAGVSFVIAEIKEIEKLKNKKINNYYLNLYEQYNYFVKNHQMRFTPPVQTLYALKQAIEEAKQETIEKRYKRYSKSWQTLVAGLEDLGLKYLIKKEFHSKIVTSIVEPDCQKYNFIKMHDFLKEKGFTIYPGKVSNLNTFRIANIGDIDYRDIEDFLVVLKDYLKDIGLLIKIV